MVNHELEIRVHGRVQGVRFRQIIRRKARALSIYGHVMNRADGSVEIIAQGARENLLSNSAIHQDPMKRE